MADEAKRTMLEPVDSDGLCIFCRNWVSQDGHYEDCDFVWLKKIAGEMAKVLKEFSDFCGLQADKGPTRDDLRRAEELGAMVASVLDRYETATKRNLNEKTNQQTS